MDAIDAEKLAGNAYRTLGLSASATQAEIEAAARKMRIWPDASRVPPTIWDLPEMGPLRRGKPDIEQAVSALNQPQSRLEHRTFWYLGTQPPAWRLAARGTSIADRHAIAVRALQVAWVKTQTDPASVNWASVLQRVQRVFSSEDLLNRQLEIERSGQFDKQATDREIAVQLSSAAAGVAAGVVRIALNALDEGRLETVGEIAAAISSIPAPVDGPHPSDRLLNQLEDQFTIRANRMEQLLRKNLRTNRQTPDPFFSENLKHASAAALVYDKDVAPVRMALLNAAGEDRDRTGRLNHRTGQLLILLAMGWEWAGKYDLSKAVLNDALGISQGTMSEYQAKRELQRLAELVKYRKSTAGRRMLKRFAGSRGSKRFSRVGVVWFSLVVISGLGRLFTQSSSSSSDNGPAIVSPRWPQQQQKPQLDADQIVRLNKITQESRGSNPWAPTPNTAVNPSGADPASGLPAMPPVPPHYNWPVQPPVVTPVQPPTFFGPGGAGPVPGGGGRRGR